MCQGLALQPACDLRAVCSRGEHRIGSVSFPDLKSPLALELLGARCPSAGAAEGMALPG